MLDFACGSNLSRRRLQARVPSARSVAVAALAEHRLRFHEQGRVGAREHGLPAAWLEALERVRSLPDPDAERHRAEMALYGRPSAESSGSSPGSSS